jgi:hypothetical protein
MEWREMSEVVRSDAGSEALLLLLRFHGVAAIG